MRATLVYGDHDVRVQDVPDPELRESTDAIVQVLLGCVCGSDLWGYRSGQTFDPPRRGGHEFLGVVREVGTDVRTVAPGQVVIAPFVWSCGECFFCVRGLQTSCVRGGGWGAPGSDGGQGEAVRVPLADGTLVAAPVEADDERMTALLPLTDVLGTGHHAATSAGVSEGSTVTVVGDGAVGLCAVLASRRLGASRIVVMSRNPQRSKIASVFGATDIVSERGTDGAARVRELTDGIGTDHALECVGTDQSWQGALGAVRDGGRIGYVGVPGGVSEWISAGSLYGRNIGIGGGVAPVRRYLPDLMADVLDGTLDPSPVFDMEVDMEHVPEGYAAMDERRAIKVVVRA